MTSMMNSERFVAAANKRLAELHEPTLSEREEQSARRVYTQANLQTFGMAGAMFIAVCAIAVALFTLVQGESATFKGEKFAHQQAARSLDTQADLAALRHADDEVTILRRAADEQRGMEAAVSKGPSPQLVVMYLGTLLVLLFAILLGARVAHRNGMSDAVRELIVARSAQSAPNPPTPGGWRGLIAGRRSKRRQ